LLREKGREDRDQVAVRALSCFPPMSQTNRVSSVDLSFPALSRPVASVLQLQGQLSMFLSHDWPNLITSYGDKARLFRNKPYFQKEVRSASTQTPRGPLLQACVMLVVLCLQGGTVVGCDSRGCAGKAWGVCCTALHYNVARCCHSQHVNSSPGS